MPYGYQGWEEQMPIRMQYDTKKPNESRGSHRAAVQASMVGDDGKLCGSLAATQAQP